MRIDTRSLQGAMDAQGFTKAELARRSGVSRGAVYGIFRQAEKDVRSKTVERLASALSVVFGTYTSNGWRNATRTWTSVASA